MKTRNNPCPECGAFIGHSPDCSLQTKKDAIEMNRRLLAEIDKMRLRNHKSHLRLKDMVVFWEGKYRMVVLENNALRRKLHLKRRLK